MGDALSTEAGDDALNNAVECGECGLLGPVRRTISAARVAAEADGWSRRHGGEFRCPAHRSQRRRSAAPDGDVALVALRLPVELIDGLDDASEDRGMSRNTLCRLLLADGLERLIPVDQLLTREAARRG